MSGATPFPGGGLAGLLCLAGLTTLGSPCRAEPVVELTISPADALLRGPLARGRFLAAGRLESGTPAQARDLTRDAYWTTETPTILRVEPGGLVSPVSDGVGTVLVRYGGLEARATVLVAGAAEAPTATFESDVQPVLTRFGCNSGPCHGKQRGQNGFQLSLLGFDADFDYRALTHDLAGRRVSLNFPERSLLLEKPSGALPHGGGRRLEAGTRHFETLRRWIDAGLPRDPPVARRLTRIAVTPASRTLAPLEQQQLLVTAHFEDGTSADVTELSSFQSNEAPVAAVSADGLVQAGPIAGDAAILARYMGQAATVAISIPLAGQVASGAYSALPRRNFIDGHVWAKLEQLRILPSAPASDATFLRRACIDLMGRLPTSDETRAFLADSRADKRERLVDRLLERPEYADHWAGKWVDLLRPNPYRVGIKAVFNLDAWIRQAFRDNLPYDQFVRAIVTGQGSTFRPGPATIYRDRRSPDEIAPMVSQLFLGIRLECAKCHRHPFESYGQEEFYSLAAYFALVGYKGTGLSPPISGSEEIVLRAAAGSVSHPRTGAVLAPRPLFGAAPPVAGTEDPREALAAWMLSPENPYFARVIVNRVWADLMGRGIVEPVDDLRPSNPPSNEPLLAALAARFREDGFDLKKLLRWIVTSHVYGLSSAPGERNAADTRNYSRHLRQRLRAEVIVDALADITGVPDSFPGLPAGSRAAALWTHRSESLSLDTFGRPDPNQDPPCTRIDDPSLTQALHLMNSPALHDKISSDAGRPARLAASQKSPRELVEEMYLLVYSRYPTAAESETASRLLAAGPNRRTACEDLLWALINTPEFLFKD